MSFNIGWMCQSCGPVAESKKRSINKVQQDCCKICGGIVKEWERPLNERAGRCYSCGNANFELRIWKHQLLRKCKTCEAVLNTDTNEVLRAGKTEI